MSEAAKRSWRTVLQTAVGLGLLLPAVVNQAGIPETLPWAAGALAAAGGLARVMAMPAVQALLPSWLRTDIRPNGDDALRALATAAKERSGA